MQHANWRYDTAEDMGLTFVNRLKRFPREPDPLVYGARFAATLAIRAALRAYNRFEIIGRDNLPREGSFVLVANHASHLDAVALLSAFPLRTLNRVFPLAARDYFCSNELRFVFAAIIANVILCDRKSKGGEGLKLCRRLLETPGNVLVMFPEGTRAIDDRVGTFRRGVGLLLAGASYPAVPCYLDGPGRALPKGGLIPRPKRVRLAIGEPRSYKRVESSDAGALQICADLRGAVIALGSDTRAQTARSISQEVYQ
jgi:1-acyl-sn-glycerol-3-phosphate acyltransferase